LLCLNGLSDLALVRTRRPVVGHCLTPIKALHDPHALQSLREQKPRRYQMVRMLGAPFQVADKALWRRIDHVVAISEETKRRVVSAGLRAPDDVAVIHPGVDVEHFSVGETSRDPVLLSAGRISWHKNIELAIDTLREVRARGLPLRLVVAGYVDGPGESYLAALRSRATDLPVDFVRDPSDEQVAALYRTSEAVLFTPRNEDFGLVPLEAMACGTPVVATNQGGPRETVVDGVTGFLAEPTATAFADAVEKVVRRTDRTSMVSAARARAEDFSWSRYVTAMDDAMELTASKPQRRGR
jgi:glycosyltransferase involved in cell wall biosynthesis